MICALPIEASSLTKQKTAVGQTIVLKNNLLVHVSGMGDEQARAGALNLINRGVTTLISWGTAGGLESTLRRGQLLLPDQVINEGNQVFSVDKLWQDHLRTRWPSMWSSITGHYYKPINWSPRLRINASYSFSIAQRQ